MFIVPTAFLLLSGVALAVIVLIVVAIANGRVGLALVGGLAVICGIPLIAIVVAFFAMRVHATPSIQINSGPEVSFDSPQGWTHYQTVSNAPPTWAIALKPVLFMAVAFIALLFLLARRGMGHAAAGGHGKIWPVFLVVPFLAFLMLGSMRFASHSSRQIMPPPPPAVSSVPSGQIPSQLQTQIHEQQETLKKTQIELAKHQAELAKQAAALTESLHRQIDQMDIHELMDKFDAPKIALHMPITPSPSPAALVIAAANAVTDKSKSRDEVRAAEQHAIEPPKTEIVAVAETPPAPPTPSAPPAAEAPSATPPTPAAPAAQVVALSTPATAVPAKSVAVSESVPATTQVETPPAPPAAEKSEKAEKQDPSETVAPHWINDPPKRTGDVRREVISTEAYESAEECYDAADMYLMLRTYERLQQLKGEPLATSRLPSITFGNDYVKADGDIIANGSRSLLQYSDYRLMQLKRMGITPDFLRREIIAKNPGDNDRREYLDSVTSSVGPMKKLYMQIEFTPAVDRLLMQHWDAHERQERFAMVGVGAGSVLSLLLTFWGLFQVDTLTKGYYTKRLFIGVPAAIIIAILFCAADPFRMF